MFRPASPKVRARSRPDAASRGRHRAPSGLLARTRRPAWRSGSGRRPRSARARRGARGASSRRRRTRTDMVAAARRSRPPRGSRCCRRRSDGDVDDTGDAGGDRGVQEPLGGGDVGRLHRRTVRGADADPVLPGDVVGDIAPAERVGQGRGVEDVADDDLAPGSLGAPRPSPRSGRSRGPRSRPRGAGARDGRR